MGGRLVACHHKTIRSVHLCPAGMFLHGYRCQNLAAIFMNCLNDPIPFTQSKIYKRDLFFESHLQIFFGIGEDEGGIHPEGLIRKRFHLSDHILYLIGSIGNAVQHANAPGIRNCGYKFW